MLYKQLKLVLALLLITSIWTIQAKASIAIVVSSTSNLDSISKKEVRSIFLGKSKTLPNGQFAIPINQPESGELQTTFNKKIINRSNEDLKTYWIRRSFSGKGTPPRVIDNDSAVKRFLNGIPGTIGYIDSANVDTSVKVILTIP